MSLLGCCSISTVIGFDRVLQQCEAVTLEPLRAERVTKQGQEIQVLLIVSALVNDAGERYAIATTERAVPA